MAAASVGNISSNGNGEAMAVDQPPVKLSISGEEEELLALKREKENDEKQLRKVSRKLHLYANARREAHIRATAPNNALSEEALQEDQQTIAEALQNVQIELDAFLLLMEKLELVRLAERRQAEEYEAMRERILNEHNETRNEIERLKVELREAEDLRERKKEYDVIAERINQLPPRSELNTSIEELESEIATIHAEQESTHEVLATKRTMMEEIRLRINDMILHGKEEPELGGVEESAESPRGDDSPAAGGTSATGGDVPSIRVEGGDSSRTSSPHPPSSNTLLNPSAPPFRPHSSSSPIPSPAGGNKGLQLLSSHNPSLRTNPIVSSPLASHASTPVRPHNHDDDGDDGPEDGEDVDDDDNRHRNEDGDVEMGEVSDSLRSSNTGRGGHNHRDNHHHHNPPSSSSGTSGNGTGGSGGPARSPKKRGRERDREHANKEDLEEGEASDGSSDLSSIPED